VKPSNDLPARYTAGCAPGAQQLREAVLAVGAKVISVLNLDKSTNLLGTKYYLPVKYWSIPAHVFVATIRLMLLNEASC
jgi:hypothetical protein